MRFLLYAHDGIGIGHVVRTCTIARALRRKLPDAQIVIASGSPILGRLAPRGCLTLGLPSHSIVPPGSQRTVASRVERQERSRWRGKLLMATAREFAPNVVLIDHLPTGKNDELVESVEWLAGQGASIVLGYRRICEDRHSTQETLESARARQLLEQAFQRILVYAPGCFEARLGRLTNVDLPQQYTGFVCRRCREPKQLARRRLGFPQDRPIVVANLGGGRWAWPLAERILQVWDKQHRHGLLVMFCGPHLEVPAGIRFRNVRLIRNSLSFPRGVAASDGVISTAGYNSMLEVLAQGRPLWAIPNQLQEVEQARSAELLHELGFLHHLPFNPSFDDALESVFQAVFSGQMSIQQVPAGWLQGVNRAVRILSELASTTKSDATSQ